MSIVVNWARGFDCGIVVCYLEVDQIINCVLWDLISWASILVDSVGVHTDNDKGAINVRIVLQCIMGGQFRCWGCGGCEECGGEYLSHRRKVLKFKIIVRVD